MDKTERLRLVIEDSGLSVLQFAIKAGVSQSNLSSILRRKRNIGSKVLMNIADTYDVNIQWLITGNGPKYKNENSDVHALSEPSVEYSKIDYKEKYIIELEQQVKLLKELNQTLQKELNEKSEIIKGFLEGSITKIKEK